MATALLIGAGGCAKQYPGKSAEETWELEVDGKQYIMGRKIWMDRKDHVVLSFAYVFHPCEPRVMAFHSRIEESFLPMRPNGKLITPKTNTLYFIQDEEVVLEKNYQELGIDASRLNAESEVVADYLRPILETLIRENVPKQEVEMEEN